MVAAFIKRLGRLSLCIPAPSAVYCIAQITWLIREHPECLVLLHRDDIPSSEIEYFDSTLDNMQKGGPSGGPGLKSLSPKQGPQSHSKQLQQDGQVQQGDPLNSSLWEIETLRNHFSCFVSDMATAMENPASTIKPQTLKELNIVEQIHNNGSGGGGNTTSTTTGPIIMTDFIGHSYATMIETELKKASKKKSTASLNHQLPKGLFHSNNMIVGKYFGNAEN